MTLQCEVAGGTLDLAEAIASSLQEVCKVRGGVEFFEPGGLPNDGNVIDNQRDYD